MPGVRTLSIEQQELKYAELLRNMAAVQLQLHVALTASTAEYSFNP